MKLTGKAFRALLLLTAFALSCSAKAELSASVDRDRVALGDTIQLTISATGNEPINNIDLRPLTQDFQILQRSTASSTNIINGERSSTRQVILDIVPKREGSLRVPSLRVVGSGETNYLLIAVGPATSAAGDPLVSFEAELDADRVYVQGQAILTLRIQQAINLDSRSITDLQLDNAFVKQLEQKSFQRTINNRPWLVHEIRYAIFPEQSGELVIPAQTFSARESQPRRSAFDRGGAGRQLTRKTEALTLLVLPSANAFPGSTWLPARQLQITESWSTPPDQLRVGESATRRITLTGEGLQGAQLPPTLFPATKGLKFYPDQPVISDAEVSSGLQGVREDSAALVPTREGNWNIPEVRIPWWDTVSGELRYAVLPARNVIVGAALDAPSPLNVPVPTATAPIFDNSPIAVAVNEEGNLIWQVIAFISTAGWVLTVGYLLIRRKSPRPEKTVITENLSEAAAFKQLLAACTTSNAQQARKHIIAWTAALFPDRNIHSLEQVETVFSDDELARELQEIDNGLYSPQLTAWDGKKLSAVASRLRKSQSSGKNRQTAELQLYPQQA
ncbi:MAG: BatD family protein [Halioglobus sp.]